MQETKRRNKNIANNYQLSYGQSQPSQNMPQSIPQFQSQQFFPQPQGNVYTINNSLEVANVPMSAGLSVALCLSKGLLYLKSMQNGNPIFMAYKIMPYDNTKENQQNNQSNQNDVLNALVESFQKCQERLNILEKEVKTLKKNDGGKINELI